MKSRYNHYLSKVNSKHKYQYRDPLDECSFTEKAIHVEIGCHMMYCFNNFHKLPHGSCRISKELDHEKVLSILGNKENGTIVNKITTEETYSIVHDEIKVFYPGSNLMLMFHNLNIDYNYWLLLVLEQGEKSSSRDDESMGGISKRITIGWGPKQHDDYKKTMYHHKKNTLSKIPITRNGT